jgi:hypothetical protein
MVNLRYIKNIKTFLSFGPDERFYFNKKEYCFVSTYNTEREICFYNHKMYIQKLIQGVWK